MKKILGALSLVLVVAASVMAADVVVFPAKVGNVTFNHKSHSAKFECKVCHGAGAPSKITIDKNVAHTLCRDCHKERKVGVEENCKFCHKK